MPPLLLGYARVSVASGASWNPPGLNSLKAALSPVDCVKVTALDNSGRSLT